MKRSLSRAGAAAGAALLMIVLSAAPAFACGGLIGPNGAVNLLRTTTLDGMPGSGVSDPNAPPPPANCKAVR